MATQIKTMQTAEMQKITPFLWFDSNAEQAAIFYTTVFNNSSVDNKARYTASGARAAGRTKGSVMTVGFRLEDQEFVALNGGPVFEITPAISFFVNCSSVDVIDMIWQKLSKEGKILMPLDKYPFSERFGWLKDRFGVTWQLSLSSDRQKIVPYLMFAGAQHGKAEEAMNYYSSLFKNSGLIRLERYDQVDPRGVTGTVKHGTFFLANQEFMVMDSNLSHPFTFTPGFSFVVKCKTQDEIDYFWGKLSDGGDERAQQCGWLQDKFGISWQIVPAIWSEMLINADEQKAEKLMQAVLKMKKLDLAILEKVDQEG